MIIANILQLFWEGIHKLESTTEDIGVVLAFVIAVRFLETYNGLPTTRYTHDIL